MLLSERIELNRKRQARYKRAEKILRQIRLRIFDYEDESPEKLTKAQRIMDRCKEILAPLWKAQQDAQRRRRDDQLFRQGY